MPERRSEKSQGIVLPSNVYFLADDYFILEERIDEYKRNVLEVGQMMGDATDGGGDTFHDNFAHEQAIRDHEMQAVQLVKLLKVRERAKLVLPDYLAGYVGLGRITTFEDLEERETLTYQVGSYMTFDREDAISYVSPVAKILIGGRIGETRTGKINEQTRSFKILDVI